MSEPTVTVAAETVTEIVVEPLTAPPVVVVSPVIAQPSVMVSDMGVAGPPGPQGPAGPSGMVNTTPGQPRFVGVGPPEVILGASPGDQYLDETTGDIYTLL